jgi:hypothetical protein
MLGVVPKNNKKPIQNINTINNNLINLKMINKSVFDVIMKSIRKENYYRKTKEE